MEDGASEKPPTGKRVPEVGRGGGLWPSSDVASLPCPVSLGEHVRVGIGLVESLHPESG